MEGLKLIRVTYRVPAHEPSFGNKKNIRLAEVDPGVKQKAADTITRTVCMSEYFPPLAYRISSRTHWPSTPTPPAGTERGNRSGIGGKDSDALVDHRFTGRKLVDCGQIKFFI